VLGSGLYGPQVPVHAPAMAGGFAEAFAFVKSVSELAEAEGHHPQICFGWGYTTVSLQTKKIKGLHENDFIMAAKLDQLARLALP